MLPGISDEGCFGIELDKLDGGLGGVAGQGGGFYCALFSFCKICPCRHYINREAGSFHTK